MCKKDYKYLFLEKYVLGQKTNINNSDEVIKKCISLAYDDMLVVGKNYLSKGTKESITAAFYKSLKENKYKNPRKIINNNLTLFGGNNLKNQKTGGSATSYGLCQKLVNMTFKYLNVFSDYTGLNINFRKCDCPLDSTILKKLGRTDVKWSRLEKSEYENIQKTIKTKLKDDERYNEELQKIGNLAYDFLNW